ncbi:MAG TPA: hypothetical protein PK691_12520 [Thermomicrobiales bacterium]|nr:hypothetical protein [Thermomicrobiales bacterium]
MHVHTAKPFSNTELLEQANNLVMVEGSISSVAVITPEVLRPREVRLARHMAEISHVDLLVDTYAIRLTRQEPNLASTGHTRSGLASVCSRLPHPHLGFPNLQEGTR